MLANGCSPSLIKPIPEGERYTVCILPMNDLTGGYDKLDVSFETLAESLFQNGAMEVVSLHDIHGPIYSKRSYPNPFRIIDKDKCSEARFVIEGDVERLAYEPVGVIQKMITNYDALGLIGLSLPANSDDMGAFVQYRIHVKQQDGNPIDSFIILGTSRGDINEFSRRQLENEANSFAIFDFSQTLLNNLNTKLNWDLAYNWDTCGDTVLIQRKNYYRMKK